MPEATDPSRPLLVTLGVLTMVSGIVDAVSYLGLGHVFTANMTGNVVLLGFGVAGAPGFSTTASLASLGTFLVGAVVAGRMTLHVSSRRRWLLLAMAIECLFTAGAAMVAATHGGHVSTGLARYLVIVLLAFAMGIRNATVRRLSVSGITTTVLTMTLTGLASDSTLAGGTNPEGLRRLSAVALMFLGAIVGAVLYLHVGATWPLSIVAVGLLVTDLAFARSPQSHQLDASVG
jgi:uncharacterized membrane protein YoaK (UPF0700 family)